MIFINFDFFYALRNRVIFYGDLTSPSNTGFPVNINYLFKIVYPFESKLGLKANSSS